MTASTVDRHPLTARDVVATTLMALLMTQSLTGCAADRPPSAAVPDATDPSARVIVRFAAGTPDPVDPAFLADLARATDVVRFEPIRPMSGDAQVMTLVCRATPLDPVAAPCETAIARVAANPRVVSIERDARARLR